MAVDRAGCFSVRGQPQRNVTQYHGHLLRNASGLMPPVSIPGSSFTLNGATITPGQDFGSTNRSLYWFNPKAFAVTAPLTFGTSGRDLIASPAFWNWDASLFKAFHITERAQLQFRAEFFNALNQVRFNRLIWMSPVRSSGRSRAPSRRGSCSSAYACSFNADLLAKGPSPLSPGQRNPSWISPQ